MSKVWLVLVLLLSPAALFAQQPAPAPPTGVDILVLPATGDPATVTPIGVRFTALSATSPACNQNPMPAGATPLLNPTQVEFDDPYTAGKKCRALLPTNLPNGSNLRAVAVFTSAAGPSARSAVGIPPFDLAGPLVPHAAPTAVVVRP